MCVCVRGDFLINIKEMASQDTPEELSFFSFFLSHVFLMALYQRQSKASVWNTDIWGATTPQNKLHPLENAAALPISRPYDRALRFYPKIKSVVLPSSCAKNGNWFSLISQYKMHLMCCCTHRCNSHIYKLDKRIKSPSLKFGFHFIFRKCTGLRGNTMQAE